MDKHFNVQYEWKGTAGGKSISTFHVHAANITEAHQKANKDLHNHVPKIGVSYSAIIKVTQIKN